MARGGVKWYGPDLGYGFILPHDGGTEVLVHHAGIAGNGFESLENGEKVTYEAVHGKKGPEPKNIPKA